MTTQTSTWPEGVIARYLTVGGATVDITHADDPEATVAACGGCPAYQTTEWTRHAGRWDSGVTGSDKAAHAWAQSHAEVCRAMPKPTA